MKTLITRFLTLLRSLFLKVSLQVTLQLGKDRVNKEKSVEEDNTERENHEK